MDPTAVTQGCARRATFVTSPAAGGCGKRVASSPCLGQSQASSAASKRPTSASLQAYRSRSIGLQVRLCERLAKVVPSDRPRTAPCTSTSWETTVPSGDELQVYSEILTAVIANGHPFATQLQLSKEVYDACAAPWLPMWLASASVEAGTAGTSGTSGTAGTALDAQAVRRRLAQLEVENGLLRGVAGRLHRQLARRRKEAGHAAADSSAWAAASGSEPASHSLCSWSTMRVSATGVRVEMC
mmetsp:Transcript_22037/g.48696  ORF Transcript_22037/g.48696 Transcript_22037/m.48696 type:complete len:242 (+) Transcript_22037:172-897(+)